MSKRVNYSGEPKAKRAKSAYRPRKMTQKQIQFLQKNSGEKKGVDRSLAVAVVGTVNTNASATVLNAVTPGVGSFNRTGRKIFNKSIRLKGVIDAQFTPAATTADITGLVLRMVVVWDKQPATVLPEFDDIFGDTAQNGTESTNVLSLPKYDQMNRFQILRDKCWSLNPPTFISGGTSNEYIVRECFDEYIKLGNRTTVFSGQTDPSTIADIASGGLYVYWRATNDAAVAEVNISGISTARLRYTD